MQENYAQSRKLDNLIKNPSIYHNYKFNVFLRSLMFTRDELFILVFIFTDRDGRAGLGGRGAAGRATGGGVEGFCGSHRFGGP